MIQRKSRFFNDKQTIETFAVGKANSKAVKAVQEWMTGAKKQRIVFLYGGTGCGKTHLTKAFYKQMLKQGIQARMRNVDGFTEELIGWFRIGGTIEEYYENYSKLTDVLIIDDIQGFEKTPVVAAYCKELVKRFIKEKKKVWLISDSKATIYRWPGGVLAKKVQIKNADKELKKEILRKYAEARGFQVPEEILEFISDLEANAAELTGILLEGFLYSNSLGEKLDCNLMEKIWERRMSQKRREKR